MGSTNVVLYYIYQQGFPLFQRRNSQHGFMDRLHVLLAIYILQSN